MLLGLRTEAQFVDVVDDLAQVVTALDPVLDLAEDFPDFVLDGIRPAGLLFETVQVGKELQADELAEITAGHGLVVIELAVFPFGRGPAFPAVVFVQDETVALPLQLGFVCPILLQPIEVLEEQQPGGLLGIVQLGRAPGFFSEYVVDISKCLFEHAASFPQTQSCSLRRRILFPTPLFTRVFTGNSDWWVPRGLGIVAREASFAGMGKGMCRLTASSPSLPHHPTAQTVLWD